MNFPALNGETVTEAHTQICVERGHATHTVDGVLSPHCPRCGEAVHFVWETPEPACTIPCDGTGWTGNPRERCLTHYEPCNF